MIAYLSFAIRFRSSTSTPFAVFIKSARDYSQRLQPRLDSNIKYALKACMDFIREFNATAIYAY